MPGHGIRAQSVETTGPLEGLREVLPPHEVSVDKEKPVCVCVCTKYCVDMIKPLPMQF